MSQDNWPEFLTVAEVATILRVSKMTIYRMAHNGTLESVRVGRAFRVRSDALRAYLKPPVPAAEITAAGA